MKQRVGLACAFALDPRVLLMDESFGALDALTRGVMQSELLRIWETAEKIVLLVTHDVDEALLLADCIMVLNQGPKARIKADIEAPFERPRSRGPGTRWYTSEQGVLGAAPRTVEHTQRRSNDLTTFVPKGCL